MPTPTELPFTRRITEKAINLDAGPALVMPKPDHVTDAQWKKLQADETAAEAAMIPVKDYTLAGQAGAYVGWSGILRSEHYDPGSMTTIWTVQHTYLDG